MRIQPRSGGGIQPGVNQPLSLGCGLLALARNPDSRSYALSLLTFCIPKGSQAISRWSRSAPPVYGQMTLPDPNGVTALFALTPLGSVVIGRELTGGALRDHRLIAENRFAVGCLALSGVKLIQNMGNDKALCRRCSAAVLASFRFGYEVRFSNPAARL